MNESDFMPPRAFCTMIKGLKELWGLPVAMLPEEMLKGKSFDTVVFDLLNVNIDRLEKAYSVYVQRGALYPQNNTDLIQATSGAQAIQTLKDFKKVLLTLCPPANCSN